MNWPEKSALYQAIDITWPAAEIFEQDGWTLRNGAGGGKRVSAATALDPNANIAQAEAAQAAMGQARLFMITDGQEALDRALQARGYQIIDPVVMLGAELANLPKSTPANLTVTPTPNAAQAALWADGGIGPARLAIMQRAAIPRACLSLEDKAVAFAACAGPIAMVHALEVAQTQRRQGLGQTLMAAVHHWAMQQGATWMTLLTIKENTAALGLYRGLGMHDLCHYHYRIK